MARQQPAVTIDENLVAVARAVAEQSGMPVSDAYERALRRVLVEDVRALLDQIEPAEPAAGIVVSEADAERLAHEEAHAHRAEHHYPS